MIGTISSGLNSAHPVLSRGSVVTNTTGVSRVSELLFRRRQTSNPSTNSMLTFSNTMSGLVRANSSRELRQSGAVTTSNPFSQREFLQQFAVDRVIIHNRDLPGH